MRKLVPAAAIAIVTLCACSRDSPAGSARAEDCDHSASATGHSQKVSHPKLPTACYGVVMMCNYCAYDADGRFTGAGSDACGACVGADF